MSVIQPIETLYFSLCSRAHSEDTEERAMRLLNGLGAFACCQIPRGGCESFTGFCLSLGGLEVS